MDKNKILEIAGIVGLVGGSAALYLAGVGQETMVELIGISVAGVGLILSILGLRNK